ncbi:MAG TPA: hypothetical protein VGG04_07355 [Candidatus Sulfotelmatobacter sp.]
MKLKNEVEQLLRPLVGQRAWGAKVGWGSFVTIEFGSRHLQRHHYQGDWHLWLYQCDWSLSSETHELVNSEKKKKLMQLAIDNLNDAELVDVSFDPQQMATEFLFAGNLRLCCKPYSDADPKEECWILFMPDKQVASLVAHGLTYERAADMRERTLAPR